MGAPGGDETTTDASPEETTADASPDEITADASPDDPERRPSRERARNIQHNTYAGGYDAHGATRIGVGSATSYSRLERLIRHNEGRHRSDGRHSTREAARDKTRITQSLCTALDVPDHQQREAVATMARLNLDRFGQQKRIEKVALGVIRFVVDRDRRRVFLNGREPAAIDWNAVEPDELPDPLSENPDYQSLCDRHDVPDTMPKLVRKNVGALESSDAAVEPYDS